MSLPSRWFTIVTAMLSVEDLTESLGLSDSAVRRRINALNGVMEEHIKRGKKSKILVDSGGLEILRQLEDLREQGLTIQEAVSQIREEVGNIQEKGVTESLAKPTDKQHEASEKEELLRDQINQLQDRVEYLKNQVEKKDKKLDEKEEQIQRLLPGKVEQEKPEASPWELFKNWLFKPR